MPDFRYYHPIDVRYGDLDPQGHVNNAKYLTYLEQARLGYLVHQGLWDGKSFDDLSVILASVQLDFTAPIQHGEKVRVGVRVTRLGKKSLEMTYLIENAQTHKEMATSTTVLVAYSYREQQSVPIPEVWRHAIATFEDIPAHAG